MILVIMEMKSCSTVHTGIYYFLTLQVSKFIHISDNVIRVEESLNQELFEVTSVAETTKGQCRNCVVSRTVYHLRVVYNCAVFLHLIRIVLKYLVTVVGTPKTTTISLNRTV